MITRRHLLGTAGAGAALAVSGLSLPTFTEAGYTGFDVSSWFALYVVAGTPQPIIDKVAADVTRVVRSPEMSARLTADGWTTGGGTPEEFTKTWLATAKQLGEVIKQRHITIQ